MNDPLDTGDLDKDVARRLTLARMAYTELAGSSCSSETVKLADEAIDQDEFGLQAGMKQSRYNQYETAKRSLTLQAAFLLCNRYSLTLDWIYRGDPSGLPSWLHAATRDLAKRHGMAINDRLDELARKRTERAASKAKKVKKTAKK